MAVSEKFIENKMKNYLKANGYFYYKHIAGNGMIPGISDIIAIINGYYVGIEVKRKGGSIRETQVIICKKVRKSKGVYVVIDNLEDLKKVIELVEKGDIDGANKIGLLQFDN